MAAVETKLFEDAECIVWGQTSVEHYPDGRPYFTAQRVEWKAGSVGGNVDVVLARAQVALTNNAAALAKPDPTGGNTNYLGVGAPTNAQVVAQVRALTQQNNALVAQVTALTRQNNALIHFLIGNYTDVSDT